MRKNLHLQLSRRESQIMDVLFRLGEASVGEVVKNLEDDASYNSIRTILRILEEKGLVVHRQEGVRYIYRTKVPAERAVQGAVEHLVETFFKGSVPRAAAALLDGDDMRLSEAEYEELAALLERARAKGGEP